MNDKDIKVELTIDENELKVYSEGKSLSSKLSWIMPNSFVAWIIAQIRCLLFTMSKLYACVWVLINNNFTLRFSNSYSSE